MWTARITFGPAASHAGGCDVGLSDWALSRSGHGRHPAEQQKYTSLPDFGRLPVCRLKLQTCFPRAPQAAGQAGELPSGQRVPPLAHLSSALVRQPGRSNYLQEKGVRRLRSCWFLTQRRNGAKGCRDTCYAFAPSRRSTFG